MVERLLDANQLQRVPVDDVTAPALLSTSSRQIGSARKLLDDDPDSAYVLAYDASRKAATALLAHQGLRPTSAGGRIAVVEAMEAQFPSTPGLRSLDRLRRRRNQSEYADPRYVDPIDADEAAGAITVAEECIDTAVRLLDAPQLGRF